MAGAHLTHTPDVVTYSIVITKETLCIALTMAALHDLEVKGADVLDAYMMALNREKKTMSLGMMLLSLPQCQSFM